MANKLSSYYIKPVADRLIPEPNRKPFFACMKAKIEENHEYKNVKKENEFLLFLEELLKLPATLNNKQPQPRKLTEENKAILQREGENLVLDFLDRNRLGGIRLPVEPVKDAVNHKTGITDKRSSPNRNRPHNTHPNMLTEDKITGLDLSHNDRLALEQVKMKLTRTVPTFPYKMKGSDEPRVYPRRHFGKVAGLAVAGVGAGLWVAKDKVKQSFDAVAFKERSSMNERKLNALIEKLESGVKLSKEEVQQYKLTKEEIEQAFEKGVKNAVPAISLVISGFVVGSGSLLWKLLTWKGTPADRAIHDYNLLIDAVAQEAAPTIREICVDQRRHRTQA